METPKNKSYSQEVNLRFSINWPIVAVIIAVLCLAGGFSLGNSYGTENAQAYPSLSASDPQSITGRVTEVSDNSLKVDASGATWSVRYDPETLFTSQSGSGKSDKSSIHKNDNVQISGVGSLKKKTLTARSVLVVKPPTPSPKPSASPGGQVLPQ